MSKIKLALVLCLCSFAIHAQEYFPKNDGVKTKNTNFTALTNAKIYVTPTQILENATLLIKDGKVVSSGKSVAIPKNTNVIDLEGKTIYPSFIDMYSSFGIEKPKQQGGGGRNPQYDPTRTGYYWNDHIMPEQKAISSFKYDDKAAKELMAAGFGVVNTHVEDGIVRGTGALVALNNEVGNGSRILDDNSAQYLSFEKSEASKQAYPTSTMGAMALLRQMYYDADWYAKGNIETKDLSLEALNKQKNLVQIFDAGSRANALRADKVGDLFQIQYVILGGGDEYERIADVKAMNATLILPVNFRDAYDVENSFLSASLSLSDMRAWSQEPANAKVLAENGISFAFTTNALKSPKTFLENVRKAIAYGLPKETALAALTTIPANVLGKSAEIGSLQNGAYANFLITSGDIFDEKSTLFENWVQGERTVLDDMMVKDIKGDYEFSLAGEAYKMSLKGEPSKLKVEITSEGKKRGSKINYSDDWLYLTMTTQDSTKQQFIRLTANLTKSDDLNGKAIFPDGNEMTFYAKKVEASETASAENPEKTDEDAEEDSEEKDKSDGPKTTAPLTYPNVAFGFDELPKQETLLFKNATVWTNETDGTLENTDVLIKNGKIAKIGKNLSDASAKTIDATGKHLTAGIIDEHSHIATSSVNEAGQNSTAEVTIEDVLDAEDIDIYRNLAGGVTSIQVLHGSANPIGGRSAIIKLKWGESPENLIYKESPQFIKFALGENVKQSNWGDEARNRFPQSRMGVEQLYIDYFTRAQEYAALKKSGKPYRKDIEMDVLAEILNSNRFITCHSYVQSEINMLMKVADQFDFNINTFTHILEGYKVADKMAAHGVGGSTFSDWWAYKYEVNDAIPYNAAIMHNAGVTVAINSDDGEMARRLNQEAAKSVKYGGISELEAWKFVTLNPAKLLHIDDRVGSLKVGKDADVVLWSDHPMSIYAKAEKTIIEGVTYFDLQRDQQMRTKLKAEKSDLINQMLIAKNKGLKTQPIKKDEKVQMHCDYIDQQ
ncbi:amidohydrolase family protein [Subsaximicrobium wynnwilliamsii]|uniref:Amidohydrolase family protein n=1 Tax=Subsaximicrobium wynnwilliamsii TaxID=291179 RepID=A0A5C6ZLJ7_9FLAO|nr:amidohydrolase family protein [Subsaximicrobium wynnwilliamsii]TXD84864.1 amidohydrolase family protein [Subsaximicrobium wynnwilliamsii]TXD90535.1 amidohydrolase family protein [Subsaximicrobium wynnwilliamsii]TXE05010.1 amidohydrolase family protein [Subsaximicrobium wynnwilliamsii]